MSRPWRRLGAWAIGALVLLVAVLWVASRPAPAPAMVAATPADGSVLAQGPAAVELSFTGLLDPGRSHVWAVDVSGASVTTARPATVDAGRISQPVTIVAPSVVRVTYHVTFVDGAQINGALAFSVGPGRAAPDPPAAVDHAHGIDPFSAALLVVDGVVALTVVVLLLRRPRRKPL